MSERLEALFRAARSAMRRAYAPYSGFRVGAAVIDETGALHVGCNVENAAYPVGTCAEAGALAAMVGAGGTRVVEAAVVGGAEGDGILCTPCGACRQRLREFAADDVPIHVCGPEGPRRTVTLGEILPLSFGPDNLAGGGPR
ncbi:MAG: cytidine deaminase [Azospirillaceae bacterium]